MAGTIWQHRPREGSIWGEQRHVPAQSTPRSDCVAGKSVSRSVTECWRFQEDMLWISDPKALQYIYQTSGYNFPKQPERRILSRLIGDSGLTWAEGAHSVAGGARECTVLTACNQQVMCTSGRGRSCCPHLGLPSPRPFCPYSVIMRSRCVLVIV